MEKITGNSMGVENNDPKSQNKPLEHNGMGAVGEDYESLKADFKKLREDFTHMASSYKETADNTAKGLVHDLKETGEQAGMKVMDQVGKVKDKGGEMAEQLEHQIREHPMISLMVAFGVGLVASRMMERR